MNKKGRIAAVAIALSALILLGLCSGCSGNINGTGTDKILTIHDPANGLPSDIETEDGFIDISPELVPLTEIPPMFATVLMPEASGTNVQKNGKAEIDMSNAKDGYVMVKYLKKTDKTLKVMITGPSTQYTYTLKSDGEYAVFPLSDGNGKYQIKVWENVEGTQYSLSCSASVDVKLDDEFAPFIRPNQYVNYTDDSNAVKKAAELIEKAKAKTMPEKIKVIYNYVIGALTYDKELAASVKSGYVPDIDKVLEKGKGICFDYAAVMTAMLRSQDIPAKLVIGYAGTIYHAWISAYSEETGWVENVIYFDGKQWQRMDPTFASTGNQNEEIMKYIGDGKNYTVKYLY